MRTICAHCGADLAPAETCERCHPLPMSLFAEAVLTAAVSDGRSSGPLDGEALRMAAAARKEQPS